MELSENELPRKLMITIAPINIWLVVSNPLKNMKVSWDYYTNIYIYIYIYKYIWKVKKNMFQTTNQTYIILGIPGVSPPSPSRESFASPFKTTTACKRPIAATRRMKSMDYPLVNQFANLNMAIEIVDLPMNHGDFP